MKYIKMFQKVSAIRAVASAFGILVGLAGIEHGFFEILQGNVKPDGLVVDAIGSAQRFWEYSSETVLTIIPNMLLSGILAMFFGIIVTIWAAYYVDSKYGARVLMSLSIILWLVGGGFAPVFMAIFAFIAASRIDRPLNWWRAHLPGSLRGFLAKLWPWSIILFVVVFVLGVEIAIFGYPLLWIFSAEMTYNIQWDLAYIMIIFWPLSILTAIAYDIEQSNNSRSIHYGGDGVLYEKLSKTIDRADYGHKAGKEVSLTADERSPRWGSNKRPSPAEKEED